MKMSQELIYLDVEHDQRVDDLITFEYVEPIITNTRTAIVTNKSGFHYDRQDVVPDRIDKTD